MTSQQIRAWRTFLLTGLLAIPSLAFPGVSARRQAEARAAYDEAMRLRAKLESQPEASRQKEDYKKAIQTLREVYRLNPACSKTPVALAAVAQLYEEMGHIFSSNRYYLDSARAYNFLISQYPWGSFARDALYALGELYRSDLQDPEEARSAFQKFLEQYPRSAKAAEARKKLKEIEPSQKAALPAQFATAHPAAEKGLPDLRAQVTGIRRWVGPNYTRIVIGLEGEAEFDTSRLANPDRIVLDLSNTELSRDLARRIFPFEDGYLHQIRIAQFKPDVTRVVLDVAKIEDYSVFTLPNPFRLIIDIHGVAAAPDKSLQSKLTASLPARPAPAASPDKSGSSPTTHSERITTPQGAGQERPSREPRSSRGTNTGNQMNTPAPAVQSDTTETSSAESPSPSPANVSGAEPDAADSAGIAPPLLPAVPSAPGSRTLTRVLGLKIGRVVIDPGHGGHDTGTVGPTGLCEKDVVLDVALRLKKLLERNTGSPVILTRSNDSFIPLEERTAIANEKAADLFVSIHVNASHDRSARGVETYYLNFTSSAEALEVAARENATSQESVHQLQDLIKKIAMTEKVEESHAFARLVQHQVHDSLVKAGGVQRDRGLKKAPFVVLIGANMPSILAEISFLTNPRDERMLKKTDYRQKIAEGLYLGIARYVNTLGRAQVSEQARRAD